jgi:hypothetical protein
MEKTYDLSINEMIFLILKVQNIGLPNIHPVVPSTGLVLVSAKYV